MVNEVTGLGNELDGYESEVSRLGPLVSEIRAFLRALNNPLEYAKTSTDIFARRRRESSD